MVSIIISGHGAFSTGLLDAFNMIFGEDSHIKAVPFLKGEGLPQLQDKFKDAISEFSETDSILFLVDIFGGTPYNAAAQVVYPLDSADIVTGINLPTLLEIAAIKDNQSLDQIVSGITAKAVESVKIFSNEVRKLKVVSENADEEEDDLL